MSYWGSDLDECDYAFDALGASISWIRARMFKDAENVIAKRYPEQAILASVCCLRLLGERFPKNLSVSFGKRDLARTRQLFDQWHDLVKDQLPAERWNALRESADREFALFEERILGGTGSGRESP